MMVPYQHPCDTMGHLYLNWITDDGKHLYQKCVRCNHETAKVEIEVVESEPASFEKYLEPQWN